MQREERRRLFEEVAEEIVLEDELDKLLDQEGPLVAYDGFEPSGTNIHIAQGLLRAININKMIKAGCTFKILVADWHAWANNKMGGNLEHIQAVGKYLIEVWKACDMDFSNVEFIWASELVKDDTYWKRVMQIARLSTVKRITRCSQIMGRGQHEALQASQILYPCMQAADIYYLKADICQLGMDQRKVNMLAREAGPKLGLWKPVVISHHMLLGLQTPTPKLDDLEKVAQEIKEWSKNNKHSFGSFPHHDLLPIVEEKLQKHYPSLSKKFKEIREKMKHEVTSTKEIVEEIFELRTQYFEQRQMSLKMSKSKPDTAIFMTDTAEEIVRKIKKAHCPEKETGENPILEYCRYLIFESFDTFTIKCPEKYGGDVTFSSYQDLEEAYAKGSVFPLDLKNAVAEHLNRLLSPVREKLAKNPAAQELERQIKTFPVTR